MPRTQIQAGNVNLEKLGNAGKKKARLEVIDAITDVTVLCQDKNNIIIGTGYRLDSRSMTSAGNGHKAGDYKIDIQTVTKQKSQSRTVAIAYMDPTTSNASLQDLKDALEDSLSNQNIDRVT